MSDTAFIKDGVSHTENEEADGVRRTHKPTEGITLHNSAFNVDAPCELGVVPGEP